MHLVLLRLAGAIVKMLLSPAGGMLRWALHAGMCPWDMGVSQERCGVGGHLWVLWVWWLSKGSAPKICWSLEWDSDRLHKPGRFWLV